MSECLNAACSDDVSRTLTSCLRNNSKRKNLCSVAFPADENQLITGYLEPPNPWEYAENLTREDLIDSYKCSCRKHGVQPLKPVLKLLEEADLEGGRNEFLNLKGLVLETGHCESLEEVLKRIQFKNINLEGTSLDDEGSVALFDMVEYYEAAIHLNISSNFNIGVRGWQACSRMIKKTRCLEQLEARNVTLNEQYMPILSRALRIGSQLQVLKLENCGLAGRPVIILAAALKLNTSLKELYLADNGLGVTDAIQLGALLRSNETLQLLDISNNNIQDAGLGHISDGLTEQIASSGLCILILWNNHLTRNASKHFARMLSRSRILETLNMGHNVLTNECLHVMKDSLQQNRTLLRLGMQSTHLSCEGVVALAECIADNNVIQRIDLRDNNIQIAGLLALTHSMKVNQSVTQIDLDDNPRKKMEDGEKQYKELISEIRLFCTRNGEQASEDKDTVGEGVPERRVRISGGVSRKISLTCETLMRNTETSQQVPPVPQQHLLPEARPRGGGGRLRSPAPSPSPSPVSSPVPSPSRNRFQVSRVSEVSSPTTFFEMSPSASSVSSSRFQVTPVDSVKIKPSVTSSSGRNVTVGFSFKLNDSDVSMNSHAELSNEEKDSQISQLKIQSPLSDEDAESSKKDSSSVCGTAFNFSHPQKERLNTEDSSQTINKQIQSLSGRVSLLSLASDTSEDNDDLEVRRLMDPESCVDQSQIKVTSDDICKPLPEENCKVPESTTLSVEEKVVPCSSTFVATPDNRKLVSKNSVSAQPQQRRKISWIAPETISSEQKVPSSLEKLLGLFHHPGSFFNKSQPQYKATTIIVNQQPTANSDASFLLTSGPLATAAKDANLLSGIPALEISEPEMSLNPVPDIINNNDSIRTKVHECVEEKTSPLTCEKEVHLRTKRPEDENFNLAKQCLPKDNSDDSSEAHLWCPVMSVCGSGIKSWDTEDVEFGSSACSFQCNNFSISQDKRTVVNISTNTVGSPGVSLDFSSKESERDCEVPKIVQNVDNKIPVVELSECTEAPTCTEQSNNFIGTEDTELSSVVLSNIPQKS